MSTSSALAASFFIFKVRCMARSSPKVAIKCENVIETNATTSSFYDCNFTVMKPSENSLFEESSAQNG